MNDNKAQVPAAANEQRSWKAGTDRFLGRARLDEVLVLYGRELRSALRERSIVVNSVLLPILLYPFILWLAFTGLLFIKGQNDGMVSRVAVAQWPEGHPGLRRALEIRQDLRLVPSTSTLAEMEEMVRRGQLDLVLTFAPAEGVGASEPNFHSTLLANEARERSLKARNLVKDVLDGYRQGWLRREAMRKDISPRDWQVLAVSAKNVASGKQVGGFLLGLILPVLFVVMVAMGSFFPAVDATAGERERNTWETLISTSASRASILVSKYLYVVTLGGLAGMLNLTAMLLTVKPLFGPLLAQAGASVVFMVPWFAVPVLLLGAVLLAAFVAAGMMIFAAFARTFKEGQAMITPFYMVVLLPLMFLQVPGLKFTLPLALVPVVNVTMMVRSAISGSLPPVQIAVTLAVSVAAIALMLRLAAFIIRFEEVMLGSFGGSLAKFLRSKLAIRASRRTSTSPPLAQ